MTDATLFDDEVDSVRPHRGQHRLASVQLVRWGTFDGYHRIPVSERGFLLTGPSGSGKSTILDAISVVLVRPRDLRLNAAAGEAGARARDRSVFSYVRGAWSINADDTGEVATQQLRPGTTWSAIALEYSDGIGATTTLVRVFWAARGAKDAGGVKAANLIFDGPFDLHDLESPLRDGLNRRTLKSDLSPWYESEEYPAFQEKFSRKLGLSGDRALQLLHKTQATKGLSSLDQLLREFMLDEPKTFEIARRAVEQFDELAAAHAAVQTARRQLAHLAPVKGLDRELVTTRRLIAESTSDSDALDAFVLERSVELHRIAIERTQLDRTDAAARSDNAEVLLHGIRTRLSVLQSQHAEAGGGHLDGLRSELAAAESELTDRGRRLDTLRASLRVLGSPDPQSDAEFAELVAQAERETEQLAVAEAEAERARYDSFDAMRTARQGLGEAQAELEVLLRSTSNIEARDVALRDRIAEESGVDSRRLPFLAELLQVPEEHAEWRGAIERLLGGFARSVVIPESVYRQASAYIDRTYLGRRLQYYRGPRQTDATPRATGPLSVAARLEIADSPHADWLRNELSRRFDYACVDSLADFHGKEKALTRSGQVRHGATRHEKDDRTDVRDEKSWVLGFDNAARRELFEAEVARAQAELTGATASGKALEQEKTARSARAKACQVITGTAWRDIDTATIGSRIHDTATLIHQLTAADSDLSRIDADIAEARSDEAAAHTAVTEIQVLLQTTSRRIDDLHRALADRERERDQQPTPTPEVAERLTARFGRRRRALSLDWLGDDRADVLKEITSETSAAERAAGLAREALTKIFTSFISEWPAEAADVDADVESTREFLRILERIEHDGLPEHEARFLRLLQELATMSLAQLRRQIDQERRQIGERIDPINASLGMSEYSRGTYLRIHVKEKQLGLVAEFKRDVQAATTESLANDPARAEERFGLLQRLITRFGSEESEHRAWREQVLDVRRHVEFEAREIDSSNIVVEIHTSGVGRSGGQRVKLVTFALAAALRYQLAGRDATVPAYGTVVIDEAFDKADADFTEKSMQIFQQFGFQMILATPMKMVQTLSAFIGGAAIIDIRDRKYSSAHGIDLVTLTGDAERTAETTRIPARGNAVDR